MDGEAKERVDFRKAEEEERVSLSLLRNKPESHKGGVISGQRNKRKPRTGTAPNILRTGRVRCVKSPDRGMVGAQEPNKEPTTEGSHKARIKKAETMM